MEGDSGGSCTTTVAAATGPTPCTWNLKKPNGNATPLGWSAGWGLPIASEPTSPVPGSVVRVTSCTVPVLFNVTLGVDVSPATMNGHGSDSSSPAMTVERRAL